VSSTLTNVFGQIPEIQLEI